MAKRRFDLSDPNHVNEVRNLLLDEGEDDPMLLEDLGEESDIASQDEVEERREDSCTEQEADSSGSDDSEGERALPYVVGKDKVTKWTRKPPMKAKRRGPENIITRLPGVIGDARQARTAEECWNNLFSSTIIEIIVKYTNQYIDSIKGKFARERDIKPTDVIEVRAFMGLLYLAGAYKGNRQSLEELWGREELKRRSLKKHGIPASLQVRLRRYRPHEDNVDDDDRSPPSPPKRRRCTTCDVETESRRLTKYKCFRCKNAICLSHANYMCRECQLVAPKTFSEGSESSEDEVV
ncbi:hypothetical protein GE061_008739 [Apolygus lucorum]|uniref:PiggyBac transposable element-derived protein domain-containing protein n=1 Tax=Apolygus lucorum TaxID=248454 RepID=A0A8S9WLT5_APOLU|nr:hypothetical protein GE061_008739 [Apolygus lucorum]